MKDKKKIIRFHSKTYDKLPRQGFSRVKPINVGSK